MAPSTPFVDPDTGRIDTDQLLAEALPVAKLVAIVVAVALVPFLVGTLLNVGLGLTPPVGALFVFLAQFVLAVGTGVVLLYVVARGTALAETE
jgi:hypothetical protein